MAPLFSMPQSVNLTGAAQPEEPPAAGTLVDSDWGYATGTGDSALRDGADSGSWVWNDPTGYRCGSYAQALEVIAAPAEFSGLGYSNVLQISHGGPTVCGNLQTVDKIPQQTTHYGRFYFVVIAGDEIHIPHGIAYNCCGVVQTVPFSISTVENTTGDYEVRVRPNRDEDAATLPDPARYGFRYQPLTFGTRYRYEWQFEYTGVQGSQPGTCRLYPRLYNAAGTLIADADDFMDSNDGDSLTVFWNTGIYQGLTDLDLARQFSVGQEGSAGTTASDCKLLIAGLVIGTGGWVGA